MSDEEATMVFSVESGLIQVDEGNYSDRINGMSAKVWRFWAHLQESDAVGNSIGRFSMQFLVNDQPTSMKLVNLEIILYFQRLRSYLQRCAIYRIITLFFFCSKYGIFLEYGKR